jgi:biopolymer transport protein ExbD
MAETTKAPKLKALEGDDKLDFLEKKNKRKYKNAKRKFARDAENDAGELNLTAMMDMMTILLVFLIKSYGAADINVSMSEDLTPPTSKSTLMPVQAVTVTVSKKDIAVGEKGILKLDADGKLPPSELSGLLIVPLKDALDAEIAKLEQQVQYNPKLREKVGTEKDPLKMLTIVGDKDLPYEILFSILGTAGQSGLKYFKFLVISNAG